MFSPCFPRVIAPRSIAIDELSYDPARTIEDRKNPTGIPGGISQYVGTTLRPDKKLVLVTRVPRKKTYSRQATLARWNARAHLGHAEEPQRLLGRQR